MFHLCSTLDTRSPCFDTVLDAGGSARIDGRTKGGWEWSTISRLSATSLDNAYFFPFRVPLSLVYHAPFRKIGSPCASLYPLCETRQVELSHLCKTLRDPAHDSDYRSLAAFSAVSISLFCGTVDNLGFWLVCNWSDRIILEDLCLIIKTRSTRLLVIPLPFLIASEPCSLLFDLLLRALTFAIESCQVLTRSMP